MERKMLRRLQHLKPIKVFAGGFMSKRVVLLEGGNVVKKEYAVERRELFLREVENLRHLKGCSFVPQLLAVDKKNLSFYMTYCGKSMADTKQNREMVSQAAQRLHEEWGMAYILHEKPVYDRIAMKNTTMFRRKKVCIIDFGSHFWQNVVGKVIGFGFIHDEEDELILGNVGGV